MLLELVRRHIALLLCAACLGGAAAALVAKLRKPVFRAAATLLIAEPRTSNSGPSAVDYNLTPIRSYAPLLASPALSAACAPALGGAVNAASLPDRIRVRTPENTRLVEVSFTWPDPEEAARFVNCLTARASEENRRINSELARGSRRRSPRRSMRLEGRSRV